MFNDLGIFTRKSRAVYLEIIKFILPIIIIKLQDIKLIAITHALNNEIWEQIYTHIY